MPSKHLYYLDGWRALAVAAVVLGHFYLDQYGVPISVLGVYLFFVLSGRLMAEILFVRNSPIPTFFKRRFSRVFPALVVYVAVTYFVLMGTDYGFKWPAAALALTFTINYAMVFTHPVAVLDHIWSLCVEEHSYILLAMIAVALRSMLKQHQVGFLCIGIAAVASVNAVWQMDVLGHSVAFWRSDIGLMPIFMSAGIYLLLNKTDLKLPAWVPVFAIVAGIATRLLFDVAAVTFVLSNLLLSVAVNTLGSLPAPVIRALENKYLRLIGLWSYSIYLWQQVFYKISADHPELTSVLFAALFIPAILSYYLVEVPARAQINSVVIGRRQNAY